MARWAIFLALVLAAGVLFGHSAATGAHVHLAGSTPAANEVVEVSPEVVELRFTEAPEARFTTVQLYDSAGTLLLEAAPTPVGASDVVYAFAPPALEDGTYTVVWRAVSSVDGHTTQGSFAFSVGEETEVTAPDIIGAGDPSKALSVFSRWLTFVTALLLTGIPAVLLIVVGPALRKSGLPEAGQGIFLQATHRLWWATLVLALLASALALLMQAWRFSGGFSDSFSELSGIISDSRFGHLWLARVIVLGVMLYLTLVLDRKLSRLQGIGGSWGVFLAGALGVVATISLGSHAASSDRLTEIATAADWLHTVAAGVWVGGLIVLLLTLSLLLRGSGETEGRTGFLAALITRFSPLGMACVAVIVATGVFQWAVRIGNLDDTISTGYGWSIVAKTVLLLPMLGLAGANLLVLKPRLQRAASGSLALARNTTPNILRRSVLGEVTLGLLILVATGFLTDTSPPNMAGSAPVPPAVVQEGEVADLELTLSVTPGYPGANDIELAIDGLDETAISTVFMRLQHLDEDLGQSDESVESVSPERYRVSGVQMGLPGTWEVLVIIQRAGTADVRHTFEVTIAPP